MSNGDSEEFRIEVCERLASLIKEGMPDLPINVTQIRDLIYVHLRNELFDYDLTQTTQQRDLAEIRSLIARSAFGSLPRFGEEIDKLAESGKDRRRVVNAAVVAAADIEHSLLELMQVGPEQWDHTVAIEMQTERIVRQHQRQHLSFVLTSTACVAASWTVFWMDWLTWKQALVTSITTVVGAKIGTRFFDVYDHP